MNGSMVHDPWINYAGMIGVAGLAILIGAALGYMRAVNAISRFLKLEYPAVWHRVFQGDARAGFSFEPGKDVESLTISWIVGGIYRLGLTDTRYYSLLWAARRWLILCAALFVAEVSALGWITRDGGAALFH